MLKAVEILQPQRPLRAAVYAASIAVPRSFSHDRGLGLQLNFGPWALALILVESIEQLLLESGLLLQAVLLVEGVEALDFVLGRNHEGGSVRQVLLRLQVLVERAVLELFLALLLGVRVHDALNCWLLG
uniref:Uncharacterized protein n=1 Tax=Strombidium inclinatum TaxID=197538 RepID=A0A7S3IF90_9SPIT|eukprot:CAMPEP_0170488846 /NCGR_PEP_ID=MMETSP0208-20121228/7303_1 /TAXON_ID=197538 /ORGANISM="Strombidium inclinatum, Strain S3" /LENGTH=128 /DNA_ID=CAMNT_0010763545 /DNA_START=1134 /DNA_END=1520 /DNA_ORIENTATION=+